MERVARGFGGIASLHFARSEFLHILGEVEPLAGCIADRFRTNQTPAHIGIERRLFHVQQSSSFFGGHVACMQHSILFYIDL